MHIKSGLLSQSCSHFFLIKGSYVISDKLSFHSLLFSPEFVLLNALSGSSHFLDAKGSSSDKGIQQIKRHFITNEKKTLCANDGTPEKLSRNSHRPFFQFQSHLSWRCLQSGIFKWVIRIGTLFDLRHCSNAV